MFGRNALNEVLSWTSSWRIERNLPHNERERERGREGERERGGREREVTNTE